MNRHPRSLRAIGSPSLHQQLVPQVRSTQSPRGRQRPALFMQQAAVFGLLAFGAQPHLSALATAAPPQPPVQDAGPALPWQGKRLIHPHFQVNLANGNVHFRLAGAGYRAERTHPSPIHNLSFNTLAATNPGDFTAGFGLGSGWFTVVGSRLDFPSATSALYTTASGMEYTFSLASGTWNGMAGVPLGLTSSGSGWVLTEDQGREYHFDSSGRQTKIVSAQGGEFTIAHSATQALSTTDPIGRTCTFTYELGKLKEMSTVGPPLWSYSYDSQGRLNQVDVVGIGSTSLTYDAHGRIDSFDDFSGHLWQFQYYTSGPWSGRIEIITDPNGRKESYSYAHGSNEDKTTFADIRGNKWTSSHDQAPLPAEVGLEDPSGELWTRAYNTERRLTKTTDPLGKSYSYLYDASGNLENTITPSSDVWKYTYDTLGNMRSATQGGRRTDYTYADPDNPKALTMEQAPIDSTGQRATRHFTYYGPGVGPIPGAWHGMLKSMTDANGVETRYVYDAEGMVQSVSEGPPGEPGGVEIRYDLANRRVHTDLGGMQYPALFPSLPALPSEIQGQLNLEDLDPLAINWRGRRDSRDYDIQVPINTGSGQEFSLAQLSSTFDAYGRETQRSVQSEELLAHVTTPPGTAPLRVFNMTFDDGPTDPRAEVTTPDGETVTVRADEVGYLDQLTIHRAGSLLMSADVNRYADGRVQSVVRSDGTSASLTYNDDGQPKTVVYFHDGVRVLTISYAYNAQGLPIRLTEITPSGITLKAYIYDSQNRLTEEFHYPQVGSTRRLRYTYDLGGNRLTQELRLDDVVTETVTLHYDIDDPTTYRSANNRLMWIERFDGSGALAETEWFFYDNIYGHVSRAVSQLAGTSSFTAAAYVYDVDGLPWLSWEESWDDLGSGPTNYARQNVLETRQGDSRKRVWRARSPLTMEPLGATEWTTRLGPIGASFSVDPNDGTITQLHLDVDGLGRFGSSSTDAFMVAPLGAVRLRDDGANLVEQDSTAFGDLTISDPASDFGFAGGFGIRKSRAGQAFPGGTIAMGYRHYAPRYGRFLMRDPIGIAGGSNVYAYVNNSPTIGADPTGLSPGGDDDVCVVEAIVRGLGLILFPPEREIPEMVPRELPDDPEPEKPAEVVLAPVTPREGRTPIVVPKTPPLTLPVGPLTLTPGLGLQPGNFIPATAGFAPMFDLRHHELPPVVIPQPGDVVFR